MLIVANKMSDLDFSQLMQVYCESNWENGKEIYPDELPEKAFLLAREDFYNYLQEDFFPHRSAVYYIWTRDGEYLSALRLEKYEDGLLLQALETRPDMRGRGFAGTLMKNVLKQLPSGCKIYSHVSLRNEASLAVHSSCGFSREKEYARLLDGTVTNRYVTLSVRV